jgi:hypothetical protein
VFECPVPVFPFVGAPVPGATGIDQQILGATEFYIGGLVQSDPAALTSSGVIFLNPTGLFFNQPLNPDGSITVRIPDPLIPNQLDPVTFASSTAFDAFILLHELGHVTGVFGPDGGPTVFNASTVNGTNSQQVLSDCFQQNAKGQYQ